MNTKPNFLIFMTDHQRGDTLWQDSPVITPNIDRFRAKSVTFTQAYCPAPHCCPSRATFFTGLYPSQHGVWNNVGVSNCLSRGLYDGVTTFSEDLKDLGYDLYYAGKWHVSQEESPADRGFQLLHHNTQQYRQFENTPEYSEWDYYNRSRQHLDEENTPRGVAGVVRPGYPHYIQYGISENPFGDSSVVDAAVEKLLELKEGEAPFCLYAGTLGPHDPYFVPQHFLDLYKDMDIQLPDNFEDSMADKPVLYRRTKERYDQLSREEHLESVRRFYAFCSYEDYLFGRLLDALETSGRADHTVVIYCSDHGDYIGSHGLWAKGLPCFKEAYHVCSVIGGAGIQGGRDCAELVSLADYAPTILELAGAKHKNGLTGASLVPFLRGEQPADWRQVCFTQTNGNEIYGIQRAVFDKKWKYVFNSFDYDELYDLEKDPGELKNLIYGPHPEKSPYKEIVKEMCRKMWRFAHQTHDNCVNPYIMTALAPFGPGILKDELECF